MSKFFHLLTLSPTPCNTNKEWYAQALQTWVCPGCLTAREDSPLQDVNLAITPDNASLNFIQGVGLGVASVELLEALGKDVVGHQLEIGGLITPDGKTMNDYVSFRGKRMAFIRGNSKSAFRKCEVCGRYLYHPNGKKYLLAGRIGGSPVYESQYHGLIVISNLYRKLMEKKLSKVGVMKLGVREKPLDGFDQFNL